jgi:hypothetical protein
MGARAVSASILQRHTAVGQGRPPNDRFPLSACLMELIGFSNARLASITLLVWGESSRGLGLAELMMNADQSSGAVR